MWPFSRRIEERAEARDFTEAAVNILATSAAGGIVERDRLAVMEASFAVCERCLGMATPGGPAAALMTPGVLAVLGRRLAARGECVLLPAPGRDLGLMPAPSWTITGGWDPATWRYECQLAGPTEHASRTVPGSEVLHVIWRRDPARPWAAVTAAHAARTTSVPAASLEDQFTVAAAAPVGAAVSYRNKFNAEQGGHIRDTLEWLRRTARGHWFPLSDSGTVTPLTMPATRAAVDARRSMAQDLAAAVLGPAGRLVDGSELSGPQARELFRQALHGVIEPMGRAIAAEVEAKTGRALVLSFERLHGSDVMGRSRALAALTGAGVDLDDARRIVGFAE